VTSRKKRHHTVPRCYLQRFASGRGKIWAFDKAENREFETSIRNAAAESGFYSVPLTGVPESVARETDPDGIENALSDVEGDLADALGQIERNAHYGVGIDTNMQQRMAEHMMFLYIRTAGARAMVEEAHQKAFRRVIERASAALGKEVPKDIVANPRALKLSHLRLLVDLDRLAKYAGVLLGHYWVVLTNPTGTPFVTSDCPVVRIRLAALGSAGGDGIASPGVRVALPIGGRTILVLFERSMHEWAASLHLGCRPVNSLASVTEYNTAQVLGSKRHVFSGMSCTQFTGEVLRSRARSTA